MVPKFSDIVVVGEIMLLGNVEDLDLREAETAWNHYWKDKSKGVT